MTKSQVELAHYQQFATAGFRVDYPPEGWLAKAWDGDVLVDLIFAPKGMAVDDDLFRRCVHMDVAAVHMPVLQIGDVLASKLLALSEHHLDFAPVLSYSRALREQIDWPLLRERTAGSLFARAFFVMVTELGICEVGEAPPLEVVAGERAHEALR